MTGLKLRRVDEDHHGEGWQIKLDDQSALLLMPDGQVAASFTPDEAYPRFELLRFANSGHNVAITDGENTWHFTAWPKAFKQIKAFVQQSREASSEPELAALKRRAIFQVVLGSVVFLGGIALTLDAYFKVADNIGGGEYAIFYGAIFIGALFLFKGFYHTSEYRKLRRAAS